MLEITPEAMRRTLGQFCTGVTIVTTRVGEQVHAMTANAFTSVSLDPPLILVSIAKQAKMHGHLEQASHFGVSILSSSQERVAWHFAGRPSPDLARDVFDRKKEVHDFLEGSIAHIGCEMHARHDAGDHVLFLGRVLHLSCQEGEPLIFHSGKFGQLERKLCAHE